VTITIKLFGPLSRTAGRAELAVDCPANHPTCAAVRQSLAAAEPRLADLLPACRFAVNHSFVSEDHQIAAGDEVALIGLTSGG
jgi:molybdopterin converting factor small subunit